MKRLTAIALFAIANLAMAGTSFAQTHLVRATVPFDFTMNNTLLPAGTYTITESSGVIIVRNQNEPASALGLVTPGAGNGKHDNKLIFNQYGDQYFLSGVESKAADMSLKVPSSKQEKRAKEQLEAKNGGTTQTLVATKR
jgi:hypothetical protein